MSVHVTGFSLRFDLQLIFYFLFLQDLQAEVDAQQSMYDSLASTGSQLFRMMGVSETQVLQDRLEEMNQRWLSLLTKSMDIRYV